ncbi:MAG: DUF4097 family beta strand repeat-containing protein [Ignavibacteriaceae bacterium]|nr:DUF4097 family beta strand repeat-containing protein [Ignavibacteriaceae bacterium]
MTDQPTVITCANHPNTETLLRCNRCEKPICIKCAIQTPTGYRCKECVQGQQKVFETAQWQDIPLAFIAAAVLSFLGSLIASTSGGDIFLFCRDAEINAETSGGDIRLEYEGENKGIDISTSGGDIEIKLAGEFKADMELSTSGGDVSCSLNMSNVKKSSGSRLVGDLNGGGEKLSAHTSGGDISVTGK